MSSTSLRRAEFLDVVLIAAAVLIAALAWTRWFQETPVLNADWVYSWVALAVCTAAVVLILLTDDPWPAISVPPVIFGVTLAVCASGLVNQEAEILLAPWATLVFATSALFLGLGVHTGSRGAVVVVAGQVLILTQNSLRSFVPDYTGIVVALVAYALVSFALLRMRRALRAEKRGRLTQRMALYPLAAVAYGVCLLAVLLHIHHRDQIAVALLVSAALVALVAAVVWQAQRIGTLRRLSTGLMDAARATPWPAATMDDILVRLVRQGVRAETISLEPGPADGATITEPIAPGSYLVVRRSPDDVRFSADDRRLVGGLAALGRTSHIRAETESALFQQGVTDDLTGLWEYEHWRRFAEDQSRNRQPDELVGVVFLDFDYFKQLNETYGHLHANDVLAEVGRRLARASRQWRFARFGGDEIVGLIREVEDEDHLEEICQQIQGIVSTPVLTGRYGIVPTVTVGWTLSRDRTEELPGLVSRADADLRRRKHARTTLNKAPTSSELMQGLLAGALDVAFEPVVDTLTGRTVAWEALLRAEIGHHGAIAPPQLVEAARDLDALDLVTRKVTEAALRDVELASETLQRRLTVSVNVEAQQLRWSSELVSWLREQGRHSRAQLVLEISERQHPLWSEEQYDVIDELAGSRVPCALDDVGAGYSRLRQLARRDWYWVKLDRDFLTSGSRGLVILRQEVQAFQELGQTLVLEGVEEPGDLELARSLRISFCQGKLFGPARSGPELLDALHVPPSMTR